MANENPVHDTGRKIGRFLLIGGCSTAIDLSLYLLLSQTLPTALAKGIAMVIASLFSYGMNKHFTFRNTEKTSWRILCRYYLVFALNLAVNIGVNEWIFRWTGYKLIAFVCATAAGMTLNFLGQHGWVFRDIQSERR